MNLLRLTPWTLWALLGLAGLALIDYWRGTGPTDWPLLRGSLPNALAVPTLTFGFLMMRFPERRALSAEAHAVQTIWFWSLWTSACAVVVTWEVLQLWGNLVFDWIDLAATAVGALTAVLLYLFSRRWAFRPPSP